MIQNAEQVQELMGGDGTNLITQSSTKAYKKCPYFYWIRHRLGLRPVEEKKALRFGTNWHYGLELLGLGQTIEQVRDAVVARYEQCPEHIDLTDWAVERETLLAALTAYALTWAEPLTSVQTEMMFNLPLVNPASGHRSTKWRIGGKIDKIIQLADGRLMVWEQKSTSDNIDDGGDFWARLRIDSQASLYVNAARQMGYAVDGVMYDVFHKPGISPKKLTQGESKTFDASGEYCGQKFTVKRGEGAAMDTIWVDDVQAEVEPGAKPGTFAIRETPSMFGARLMADIASRPAYYFARREIPRTDADLDGFAKELWCIMQTINEMGNTGHWYQNDQACLFPYKCDFCQLCFNNIDPAAGVPDGFEKLPYVHPELAEALAVGVNDFVTEPRPITQGDAHDDASTSNSTADDNAGGTGQGSNAQAAQ